MLDQHSVNIDTFAFWIKFPYAVFMNSSPLRADWLYVLLMDILALRFKAMSKISISPYL